MHSTFQTGFPKNSQCGPSGFAMNCAGFCFGVAMYHLRNCQRLCKALLWSCYGFCKELCVISSRHPNDSYEILQRHLQDLWDLQWNGLLGFVMGFAVVLRFCRRFGPDFLRNSSGVPHIFPTQSLANLRGAVRISRRSHIQFRQLRSKFKAKPYTSHFHDKSKANFRIHCKSWGTPNVNPDKMHWNV